MKFSVYDALRNLFNNHFSTHVHVRYYVIVRPSVSRLSVTFVHPTQAIEIFGNVSTPFGTMAIY